MEREVIDFSDHEHYEITYDSKYDVFRAAQWKLIEHHDGSESWQIVKFGFGCTKQEALFWMPLVGICSEEIRDRVISGVHYH